MTLLLATLLSALAGDPVEIGVHRTPGKPMILSVPGKPAEEIVARKDGDKPLLCVRVNVPREGLKGYTEETAPLSADEWAAIVKIVESEKLFEWSPQGDKQGAPDWGSSGFHVKGEKQNAPRWTGPIRNGDGPAALSKRLAALAREKVKTLPLFYLTP